LSAKSVFIIAILDYAYIGNAQMRETRIAGIKKIKNNEFE